MAVGTDLINTVKRIHVLALGIKDHIVIKA